MASAVAATGKRRVPGSAISGQTEEESEIISTLTQEIEDLTKEISCLESQELALKKRIIEMRATRPPTKIAPPLEITKQLLVAFVDKLENAYQYFAFKDYVVANRLLDPLPLPPGSLPDSRIFFKEVAGRQEIRQMFPKLETLVLERALHACLDDRSHYLRLHLQSLPRFRGRPLWGGDAKPSVEELKYFLEIYPTLKGMQKDRLDFYVAVNPVLQLVQNVRSGQYQLNQNLEVELRMLMETRSLGRTFDGFKTVESNPMEEKYTKELHDLLSQDALLGGDIFLLEVKVLENKKKINDIYRKRQLKLDAIKDGQPLEDPDEMVVEAYNKYKELNKGRVVSLVTGERAVRSRCDNV